MNVQNTLESLRRYCRQSTGVDYHWQGNKNLYAWNLGRNPDTDGVVNGVVRKYSGVDSNGSQLWTLAGSFKISPNGEILRFTGLPKKQRQYIEQPQSVNNQTLETV